MTNEEIRKKITENNLLIEKLSTPGQFTLNKEVATLLKENHKLRTKCQHEFDELGYCIYCDYNVHEEEI